MKKWFENRRRPTEPRPGQPLVHIVEAPNGITHDYYPLPGVITATPHIEIFGRDVSAHLGFYQPMDSQTRVLYDGVHALNEHIQSVSIRPGELSVRGPEKTVRRRGIDLLKGDWPVELDREIVSVLARHLGWQESPFVSHHHTTTKEQFEKINVIIAKAVVQGVEPPEGWPY